MGQTRFILKILLVGAALVSPLLFPLWFTVALTLIASAVTPLAALAVGVIIDALYFVHGVYAFPYYSVAGLALSVVAFFVHRFVETSIMRA